MIYCYSMLLNESSRWENETKKKKRIEISSWNLKQIHLNHEQNLIVYQLT